MLPGKWSEWEITEELGRGSYGNVYEIERDDEIMAVKIIEIPQEGEYIQIMKEHGEKAADYCRSIAQDFQAEIDTMKDLEGCGNIVQIRDYIVEQKKDGIGWTIYIFMDSLTPLTDYAVSSMFEEKDVINLAIEIASALDACEKAGIIHRDIKPENILVDDEGNFLLSDFGLARKLNYKQQVNSVKGTYKYMAPEIYHGLEYGHTADIYSLGLVLYQFMNKRRGIFIPLEDRLIYFRDEEEALKKRMGDQTIPPPVDASEEFADIILRMVRYNPEDRYQTAEKLLKDLKRLKEGKYRKNHLWQHKKVLIAVLFLLTMGGMACGIMKYGYRFKNKSCGKNGETCSLSYRGVLTIKGKGGGIITGSETELPWEDYKNDIREIVVEKGIEILGDNNLEEDSEETPVFTNYNHLEKITLSEDLLVLGSGEFSFCKKLSSVLLPDTLEWVGPNVFENSPWLKNCNQNGFVMSGNLLMAYSGQEDSISIPDGVKIIQCSAFHGLPIKSLSMTDSVQYIGDFAFQDCKNLTQVSFGNGIIEIGEYAFDNSPWESGQDWPDCNGILLSYNGKEENIVIPKKIKQIGYSAFAGREEIKEVVIPKTVNRIMENAFEECNSLEKVTVEARISKLESYTFSLCHNLKKVQLPSSIRFIMANAFSECDKLKELRIPKNAKIIEDDDTLEDKIESDEDMTKIKIIRY